MAGQLKRELAASTLWASRAQYKTAKAIGRLCNSFCTPWPAWAEDFVTAFDSARRRAKTYQKNKGAKK